MNTPNHISPVSHGEKINAANSMLARTIILENMVGPISEPFRKAYLHDLAAMNSMVPKGYGVIKDSADRLVYSVKQIACEVIAKKWADRCRYYPYGGIHESVLYIYAGSRQYSFHVDLGDSPLPRASWSEWDCIEKGWSLSDAEYTEERKRRKENKKNSVDPLIVNQQKRKDRAENLKSIRDYEKSLQKCAQLTELFWNKLLSVLPREKHKNKCVEGRNLEKCINLYQDLVKEWFTNDDLHLILYGRGLYAFSERYDHSIYVVRARIDQKVHAILNGTPLTLEMLDW